MNRNLRFLAPVLALATSAHAATYLLDSKDHSGLVTTGSQATFGVQSFKLSVAGGGTNDTVSTIVSMPATATLNSITFVRAPMGTATSGSLYVKIFSSGADASGTPLAVSTNGIDVNAATSLSNLTWNFSGETLGTSTTYYAVFSTNNANDATGTDLVGARIAAANFGGGFNANIYGGSDTNLRGWNSANPPVGQNLDARFAISFDAVPEPALTLLSSLGLLTLLRRRR